MDLNEEVPNTALIHVRQSFDSIGPSSSTRTTYVGVAVASAS